MKIIKPSVDVLDRLVPELKVIEAVGRVCYKSENSITDDDSSAEKFVTNIVKRGHEAVLEHYSICFEASEAQFELLNKLIHQLEDNFGETIYIKRTYISYPLVSGNIRAWRDYIRVARKHNMPIPAWIVYGLCDGSESRRILFGDIIDYDDALSRRYLDPMNISDTIHTETLEGIERDVHHNITVKFTCDRGITHEIVRHRPASYAQESTRYCNYTKEKFGNECTFIDIAGGAMLDVSCKNKPVKEFGYFKEEWAQTMKATEDSYLKMADNGISPQMARSVLPNSLKTELVMTANLKEWKHFYSLRSAEGAHPQMREVVKLLANKIPEIKGE